MKCHSTSCRHLSENFCTSCLLHFCDTCRTDHLEHSAPYKAYQELDEGVEEYICLYCFIIILDDVIQEESHEAFPLR